MGQTARALRPARPLGHAPPAGGGAGLAAGDRRTMTPERRLPSPAVPLWFIAVFAPMIASQVIRLSQTTALSWLVCDWGGRLGALAVLWLVPTARTIAFTPGRRTIDPAEAVLLAIVLTGLYLIIDGPIQALING